MKYTYLLINFLTIIFPIALSFDKRVQFYKSWRFIWPGMIITGFVFLFWDVLFTVKGVWFFNNDYIAGIRILQLPLEEILFFLTVPFSCIFIYECLNYYLKWQLPAQVTKWISVTLLLVSLILASAYSHRLYTLVTFTLLYALLGVIQLVFKAKWLGKFYIAYLVSLVPFYIVNGALTSIPIVLYNNQQNMAFRVGTIPFEDHFYSMALLLMNVGFFEYFRTKSGIKS
ncbi:lycopene cyclase domain-containing protein [Mucilaginibacter agri]|uniref:lycopene cyclase domain-containing protein n=1 Tax=Mucilaginibacter agri TaxID=2695265 RepID=UPI00293BFEC8|nr:lycopene cyclase domain-containing protein [Mucilaginibacter agri]